MKKVSKVLLAAAVLAAASQGVWAGGYEGDLQFTGGIRGMGVEGSVDLPANAGSFDVEAGQCAFVLDINSYNLFALNDTVGVGFMVSIGGYLGGVTSVDDPIGDSEAGMAGGVEGLIGPAVGFNLGEAARVQLAPGFAFGGDIMNLDDTDSSHDETGSFTTMSGMVGFGIDAQVKFMPNNKVSPVVGLRYVHYFGGSTLTWDNEANDIDGLDLDVDDLKCNAFSINAGIAINFGK